MTSVLQLFGLLAIGLAWLIPNHYVPWSSAYNDASAAVGLLLLGASLGRSVVRSRPPAAAGVVMAVALIPVAQYLAGLLAFSGDMWVSTLYLTLFAAAICVGRIGSQVGGPSMTSALAATVLIAAALSALAALVQAAHSPLLSGWIAEVPPGERPYANLGQPNNLGTLLGLGGIGLLLLVERRLIGKAVAWALFVLLAVASAATLSRTSLLYGPVVLVLWLHADRKNIPRRTRPGAIALAVGIHWTVVAAWTIGVRWLGDHTVSLVERGVTTPRLRMWPILVDSTLHAPWQGYGWLQVGEAELSSVNRHPPIEELWLQGHDLLLEFVLWCGYPVGGLLVLLVVGWFVVRWRGLSSVTGLVAFGAVSIVGVHALLELPHHFLYFLVPTGLWIGVVECEARQARTLPAPWAVVPLLVGASLFVAVAKDYPAVEEDFRLMRFETRGIGALRAEKPAPEAPFLSSLTGFLRFARSQPRAGMDPAELASMEAITQRYPYGSSLSTLAVALALNGRTEEARERMISIRQMFGVVVYDNLRARLRDGDLAERFPALREFERSLSDGRQ